MLFPCLETRLSVAMVQHQDWIWGISQSSSAPLPPQSLSGTWPSDGQLPYHPQRGFRKHLSPTSAHGPTIGLSWFHTPGIQWGSNKHWTGGGEEEQGRTQPLPQDHPYESPRPPAISHLVWSLQTRPIIVSPSSSMKLLGSPVLYIYFLVNMSTTPWSGSHTF